MHVNELIRSYLNNLVNVNLTNVNFQDADITNVELPNDTQLFTIIKGRNLLGTQLPENDYSDYSFEDVFIAHTVFTRDSLLPTCSFLFQIISKKYAIGTVLPINIIKNIHLYDLNQVYIDLTSEAWYKEVLTEGQLSILRSQYRGQIGRNIILPNEVFGIDEIDIDNDNLSF